MTNDLQSITNTVGTGESYTFTYLTNQTLQSPFQPGTSFGTAQLLQAVTTSGLNVSTGFQYGTNAGEITQMTTPLGGALQWWYRTYTYSSSRSYREVYQRAMTPSPGGTTNYWDLTLDGANADLHAAATLHDQGAGSYKI